MKESTEDIILIEKYLEGNLNPEDKQTFEERLNKDDNLNRLLDEYAVLIAGVKFSARENMLGRFKNIEEELAAETKVVKMKPIKNKVWYYAAASIVLLCAVFFLLRPENTISNQELASAYFEPYPATIGAVNRSGEVSKEAIAEAMKYYEDKQYNQTIELLKGIPDTDSEVNRFYLANAYQANGQTEEAISIYKLLIEEGEMFVDQASWNLALCYLSMDRKSQAIELLNNTTFTIESYINKSNVLSQQIK